VVSHGQGHLVHQLLADLKSASVADSVNVTLTLNIHENLPFTPISFPFPIEIITNPEPKGFGANHNAAFFLHQKDSTFFCVVNPDIRIDQNPFPALIECLKNLDIGLVAPIVVDQNGVIEDSARTFPTPFKILCKALGRCRGSDYFIKSQPIYPDWLGGMFMMFPRNIFEKLNGFNERYFLYYEDVDLCARLRLLGYELVLCPAAKIVHNAQRSSHRNLKYMKWHLTSMLRFFCSKIFFQITWEKLRTLFVKGGSV